MGTRMDLQWHFLLLHPDLGYKISGMDEATDPDPASHAQRKRETSHAGPVAKAKPSSVSSFSHSPTTQVSMGGGAALKKLFVDYSQWCTVVCLNKIPSKNKWLGALFTIVFVCMLALFIFISVNLILKFFKYPSSTELTLDVQSEKFPRFSFCNENPLRRSIVDSDPAYVEISKFIAQCERVSQNLLDKDDFEIGSSLMRQQRLTRAKTMLRLLMHKLSDADRYKGGYSFTELVSECTFAGKTCTSTDFATFLHPDYGVCFTFITERNITRAGSEQALRMLMTVNQDAPLTNAFDFLPTTDSVAIRAVIHQPEDYPDFAKNGFKIGASTQASISLSSIGHSRAKKPYGNCTNEGEDTDNYYTNFTYTFNACQHSCLQRLAWDKCKCVDPLYRKADEHIYCSTPADMLCLVNLVKSSSDNISRLCDCYPPCVETRLKKTVTYGIYPSAKYKVAAGTQAQRGVLMEEQGGGRDGVADDDVDDYDHPNATTTTPKPKPTTKKPCLPQLLSSADSWKTVGNVSTFCRENANTRFFYKNPTLFTVIQGWPCLSEKPCKTCVLFTKPMPVDSWPCQYTAYEQCEDYNEKGANNMSCSDFFKVFDFIPTGVNTPDIFNWTGGVGPSTSDCLDIMPPSSPARAKCWTDGPCVRVPSSSNLPVALADSGLIDPQFVNDYGVTTDTSMCELTQLAVEAARQHYNLDQPILYGRKKRSAMDGTDNSTASNGTIVDRPGYGSCEYANKNFKGAADCINWYKRNGLMFEIYFGTLEVNTYTQSPSYSLVTMLADVSGHAGLWLGVSVVSLVEFLVLIFLFFNTLLCARKIATTSMKGEVRNRQDHYQKKMTIKGSK